MNNLDHNYWDDRYRHHDIAWDLGKVSPPLKEYIDQLQNKDIAILIPGCGNAYEAEYLLKQGFTNVTVVDISPLLIEQLSKKLKRFIGKQLKVICGDFFKLEGVFDLVLEQTFFCAFEPLLRSYYAATMYRLLKNEGIVAGVLFDRQFANNPPFGGDKGEYVKIFSQKFQVKLMEDCYNSIPPRQGTELFFILRKI